MDRQQHSSLGGQLGMSKGACVRGLVLAGVLVSLAAAGCRSTGSGAGPTEGAVTGSEFDDGGASSGDLAGMRGRAIGLETVYFDYDSFQIRDDAKPLLKGNAQTINGKPTWPMIVIEGHCDERGSDEYNLALGERRAEQVKRYLVDLGVPSSRLDTVSFGEANPAVQGHDEAAWRYNRRSEFALSR
jgi:peptidoglycan-associated lipoprotein